MSLFQRGFHVSLDRDAENFEAFCSELSVASIFLSKIGSENHLRSVLHIGDRPIEEIMGEFGIDPGQSEPEPDARDDGLTVVVSVREDEARSSSFQAGTYRASIPPHRAIRSCGIGLSDILGTRQDGRSDA